MIVVPYGEAGIYVDLEIDDAPDRARRTHAFVRALRERVRTADIVAGAGTVTIFDVGAWDALDDVIAEAARIAATSLDGVSSEPPLIIEAIYDGPDLDDVARAIGGTPRDVIDLHTAKSYRVELLGFLPGFGYLGPVDARLALPRRSTPRTSVPAGSVAIAGGFTGVYPAVSPGGWHLIARAVGFVPFDPARVPAIALTPGREVRFVAVSKATSNAREAPLLTRLETSRALVVTRAPAYATVQDHGRGGRLGDGISPSGPLDPSAFVAANLAVGNDAHAAAIEVPRGTFEAQIHGNLRISIDGDAPTSLTDGATITVSIASRAVRYLAIAGGVDVPLVLGSRATLVAAKLGGLEGRPLRRDDVLPIAEIDARIVGHTLAPPLDPSNPATLLIDPGPHLPRFPEGSLEHLLASSYRVSRHGDRVGVRLEGAPLPHAPSRLHLPVPMVRGAIEITPDGLPIILGPDHPATGGYPVLAVVRRASQALLARLSPDHEIRFVLA